MKKQFFLFLCTGVLNTIFGYSLFALFIYWGWHYSLSVLFSTVLGVLFNFKTIGKLVFKSHDNGLIWRFIVVYIIIYILNIFFLWLLKYFGFINMYFNGVILLTPLAIVSFVLNKNYVFKKSFCKGSNEKADII